jgi:hypothetical protein
MSMSTLWTWLYFGNAQILILYLSNGSLPASLSFFAEKGNQIVHATCINQIVSQVSLC